MVDREDSGLVCKCEVVGLGVFGTAISPVTVEMATQSLLDIICIELCLGIGGDDNCSRREWTFSFGDEDLQVRGLVEKTTRRCVPVELDPSPEPEVATRKVLDRTARS